MVSVGILPYEQIDLQKLRINIEATYQTDQIPKDIHDALCYHALKQDIENFLSSQHFDLLETLAQNIADICLKDLRVLSVQVKLEKLHVLRQTKSVGIKIIRERYLKG